MIDNKLRICNMCGKEDARILNVYVMPDGESLMISFCSPECWKDFMERKYDNQMKGGKTKNDQ